MRAHRPLALTLFFVLTAAVIALAAPAPAPARGPNDTGERDSRHPSQRANSLTEAVPFEEAKLFFELNDTDGDLGLHGLIDGDAWDTLGIVSPNGRQNLSVTARGSLRGQGMTELFFESDEPRFDELSPAELFARFPAGPWRIVGRTLDNERLESVVTLRHVLAAPPANVRVSGEAAAPNCDTDPLPSVSVPVVISWDPVTTSHPEIGQTGSVEIVQYQLVVEREDPSLLVFSVDLPHDLTSFTIPEDFTALGDTFKFEIVVREASGNQTAVESCFEID